MIASECGISLITRHNAANSKKINEKTGNSFGNRISSNFKPGTSRLLADLGVVAARKVT